MENDTDFVDAYAVLDSEKLITYCREHTLLALWNIKNKTVTTLDILFIPDEICRLSPDRFMILNDDNTGLIVYSAEPIAEVLQVSFTERKRPKASTVTMLNNQIAITGHDIGTLCFWDLTLQGKMIKAIPTGPSKIVKIIVINANDLLIQTESGNIMLWSILPQQMIKSFNLTSKCKLEFLLNENYVVLTSETKIIHTMEFRTGKILASYTLQNADDEISNIFRLSTDTLLYSTQQQIYTLKINAPMKTTSIPNNFLAKLAAENQSSDEEKLLAYVQKLSLIEFAKATAGDRNLFGLEPYNLPYKDGDCLFVGIAAFSPDGHNQQFYRDLLANKILENPLYRQLITRSINEKNNTLTISTANGTVQAHYPTIETYCDLMRQPGVWGRDLEMTLLSHILQRPIVLLTPENMNDLTFEDENYRDQSPIFLNHINFNHFQPLSVPQGRTPLDILAEIRANTHHLGI
ncbi:MAG: hypothetical protein M3R00_01350 [Pseudomonadota bacterium]|nr:hypothetical protein [Pseudomonadota bacterium]